MVLAILLTAVAVFVAIYVFVLLLNVLLTSYWEPLESLGVTLVVYGVLVLIVGISLFLTWVWTSGVFA